MSSSQAALGSEPRSIDEPINTNKSNINGFFSMLVAAKDEIYNMALCDRTRLNELFVGTKDARNVNGILDYGDLFLEIFDREMVGISRRIY